MNIHRIYGLLFTLWREKRMRLFEGIIEPRDSDLLLDVGGYPRTWTQRPQATKRIDCVNLHAVDWSPEAHPDHRITTDVADGCALGFEDASYDIVFCNSVIEHVGDEERQRAFAAQLRRVGRRLWVQTPAFEGPFEPHYLAPVVHWLPPKIRRGILRWLTPWGWMVKPTEPEIDQRMSTIRLLTKTQFEELFPDCVVITERILGIIPKSYIAYRTGSAAGAATDLVPSMINPERPLAASS